MDVTGRSSGDGWEYGAALDAPFTRVREVGYPRPSVLRRRRWLRRVVSLDADGGRSPASCMRARDGRPFPNAVKLHAPRHVMFVVHGVGFHPHDRMARKVRAGR